MSYRLKYLKMTIQLEFLWSLLLSPISLQQFTKSLQLATNGNLRLAILFLGIWFTNFAVMRHFTMSVSLTTILRQLFCFHLKRNYFIKCSWKRCVSILWIALDSFLGIPCIYTNKSLYWKVLSRYISKSNFFGTIFPQINGSAFF